MKSLFAVCLIGLLSMTSGGCSTAVVQKEPVTAPPAVQGDIEDGSKEPAAEQIQKQFEKNERGQGQQSLEFFRDFQEKFPQSIYYQAARFGEAWSLEQMESPSEALTIYKSVIELAKGKWPKLYARALYRSSFVYETLGNEVKAVGALTECLQLSRDLPPEIYLAEVPARLSLIYSKLERKEEALKYLREAETGLKRLFTQHKLSSEWLAKVYVQMGTLNVNQTSSENISSFIQSQKGVQRYLINAIAQNDSVWSELAYRNLSANYNFFWNQIEYYKKSEKQNTLDQLESQKEQFYILIDYIRMLNDALLLKPLVEHSMNPYQLKTFAFLEELEKRSYNFLYSNFNHTALTLESQELNDIKKPGKVLVNDFFPNEKE